jgi:hypothetical protein
VAPKDHIPLPPFSPGEQVSWPSEAGWRTGRFVRMVAAGRRRGLAEVTLGRTGPPVWVDPGLLRAGGLPSGAPGGT